MFEDALGFRDVQAIIERPLDSLEAFRYHSDDLLFDNPAYLKYIQEATKVCENPDQPRRQRMQVQWAAPPPAIGHQRNIENEHYNQYMGAALAAAISHAREVATREHIKGDRFERVNIFLTDLRRELTTHFEGHLKKLIVGALCRKEAWYDIGVPCYGMVGRWGWYKLSEFYVNLDESVIRKWCGEAEIMIPKEDDVADIQKDMRAMEALVGGMDMQLEACRKINSEADRLIDQLCVLVDSQNG